MTEPLRTVLVGCGRIGAGYADDPLTARHYRYSTHAQVLGDHPAFAWEAVVDPRATVRDGVAAKWGVPRAVGRVEDLGDPDRPEVAVIATPPDGRLEIVDALPGLRAVIVEKPLGLSLPEAEVFVAECRRREILVQVNLWRRADEQFRALAAGRLAELTGRPQAVFGVYGNGLLNNGTHIVDLVRFLLGEIETVQALAPPRHATTLPIDGDVDIPFMLRLVDGLVVTMQPVAFEHYRENSLDIWGDRGRLAVVNEGLTMLHYPRCDNRAIRREHEIACDRPIGIETTIGHALYRLYDNVAAAVAGDAPLWAPAETSLQAAVVIEAIRQSAENGRAVVEPARLQDPCVCPS